MECGICLEKFDTDVRKPMVLECGHTFCYFCIKNIYKAKHLECPMDRTKLKSRLEDIKINFSLQDVVSSLIAIQLSPKFEMEKPEEAKLDKKIIKSDLKNSEEVKKSFNSPPVPRLDHQNVIIAESNSLKACDKGHTLRLLETSLLGSNASHKQHSQKPLCIHCKYQITSRIWTCYYCDIKLCETCAQDQMEAEPSRLSTEIVCENSHSLYFYSDTDSFYLRQTSIFTHIECKKCTNRWNGSSWSCRICSYDLCEDCVNKSLLTNEVLCNKGHILQCITENIPKKCSVCKLGVSDRRFFCADCSFWMCTNCEKYFGKANYGPICCPLGHGLVCSKDQVSLYFNRTGKKSFRCHGCRLVICKDESAHCRRCEFDFCLECFQQVMHGISHGIAIRCKRNHELVWNSDTVVVYGREYKCYVCRDLVRECGSFHCEECSFDVCISCSKRQTKE